MAAAAELVRRPEVRLVTFTGPGGTGKTRLAIETVRTLGTEFAGGAVFVSLAAVRDPGLVASAISQTLGIVPDGSTPEESLLAALHGRRLLLCLDNFEQIAPAASLVSTLLQTCPGITALVTSRTPLRIQGEHELPVPPLPVPDPSTLERSGDVDRYPSVVLFVERARAASPAFSLTPANSDDIAAICARLDGLPLAIELVAPRVKILSPAALRRELERGIAPFRGGRDRPERHQTLHATLRWSYDLLDPPQQRFFRDLAVFVGSWTLTSAADVCTEPVNLVESTAILADWSFIRPVDSAGDEPRFTMLETLREFGLDLLDELGEGEAVRRRHVRYFLSLAKRAEQEVMSGSPTWLERLQTEVANLREAVSWALRTGDTETALPLCAALGWYWYETWQRSEGIARLEEALALGAGPSGARERAHALAALGILQWAQGNLSTARHTLETAVSLARPLTDRYPLVLAQLTFPLVLFQIGEREQARTAAEELIREARSLGMSRLLADSLGITGEVESLMGNQRAAMELMNEALALMRSTDTDFDLVAVLTHLSALALRVGDRDAARSLYEEAAARVQELPTPWQQVAAANHLGGLAMDLDAPEEAATLLRESVALMRAVPIGNRNLLAQTISGAADAERLRGRADEAARLYEESLEILRAEAHSYGVGATLHNLGHVALMRGKPGEARRLFLQSLGLFRDLGHQWSTADALAGLACAEAREGNGETAARLFGAADALHAAIDPTGSSAALVNARAWEEGKRLARTALGEERWQRLHAEGAALSQEEAAALARQSA
jgi:predicted ATPase